jgi:hypothetical protein
MGFANALRNFEVMAVYRLGNILPIQEAGNCFSLCGHIIKKVVYSIGAAMKYRDII